MKINVYIGIAIRIIVLCFIGMFWTFIPDHLRGFFGDTICVEKCYGIIDANWNWGARHYWYWWMMFLLFVLSLVSALMQIKILIVKNYEID